MTTAPTSVLGQSQPVDPTLTPIYRIQGASTRTAYQGQWLDTYGIVTARTQTGFFLQDPTGDNNIKTSDGIFVYTHQQPQVDVGQCVIVQRAYVDEFYAKTELSRIKSASPASVCPTAHITPVVLPSGSTLVAGSDSTLAAQLEPYEGMLVRIPELDGMVHGPTKTFVSGEQELAYRPRILSSMLPGVRIFQDQPERNASLLYLSSLVGAELPTVNWGDRIHLPATPDDGHATTTAGPDQGLVAILDYNFDKYQFLLLPDSTVLVESQPQMQGEPAPETTAADFSVCSYNLHGLGRGSEQYPDTERYTLEVQRRAQQIAGWLSGCTIIGIQEAGSPADALSVANYLNQEHNLDYQSIALPGPATASPEYPLTNALLVRSSRVAVKTTMLSQACTHIDYGVITPTATPQTERCPAGQYPLFNRPPLVAELTLFGFWDPPLSVRIINNHWKSKAGDETQNAPRRLNQARHVVELAQEWVAADPNAHLIVLGDLNDFRSSTPLTTLQTETTPNLVHALDYVPRLDRYSYIFNGYSQTLDHILITPGLAAMLTGVQPLHINADYAATSEHEEAHHVSDHDPIWARFRPSGASALGGNAHLAGLKVTVIDEKDQAIAEQKTDALGDFQVWELTPGSVIVQFEAPASLYGNPVELRLTLLPGQMYVEPQLRYNAAIWAAAMAGLTLNAECTFC